MPIGEDLTGLILGKYELHDRIGRGGMAEVYKAYHASLDRFVALKVLHPFLGEDPEFKERFEREARNIAKLRHNNIIQVFDFDHDESRDVYYMVMEFVDGPTLRNLLIQHELRNEQIPVKESIRISRALANALAYAHEHSMIHRDIKPANIMLDIDDRVVLTDFGIAKIASGQQITASGTMIGTPAYMAPEQGLGQAGDHRSDIYSLGVVMFQIAAGSPPFEAETPIGLVLKHVNDPLPVLKALNPDLPEGFEKIIYKSLAKAPDERLQSARQLFELLSNVEAAVELTIPTNESTKKLILPEGLTAPSLDIGGSTIIEKAPVVKAPNLGQLSNNLLFGALLILLATVAVLGILLTRSGGDAEAASPAITSSNQIAAVVDSTTTETPTPASEGFDTAADFATPDLEATALLATLDTIRQQQATVAAFGTPDLTSTVAPLPVEPSCNYDYQAMARVPGQEEQLVENSQITQTITLRNAGNCDWEAGTTLEFLDGLQLSGPDSIIIENTISPGERITFEFDVAIPEFTSQNSTLQSNWRLVTNDGQRIGRLLSFNYITLRATPTPTATATVTPTAEPQQ